MQHQPKISMYILHTVLYAFPGVLTRRIEYRMKDFTLGLFSQTN